jgi:dihydrofolate reductase
LPNRINIVLSTKGEPIPGVTVVQSVEDALVAVAMIRHTSECKIFIIGGHDIYKAFMGVADGMYINHVAIDVEDGDTFFPIINPLEWSRHPFADGLVSATQPSKWIYYARTKKKE